MHFYAHIKEINDSDILSIFFFFIDFLYKKYLLLLVLYFDKSPERRFKHSNFFKFSRIQSDKLA